MKIIYMGTPDFAVAPLEAILKAGHEVSLVVTQPDKQKGRGKEVQITPVKECAQRHGIPVFQPVKIKEAQAVAHLAKYPADIFVVAAFGQLLTEEILTMPRFGCINIHASLLPAYRGAAPIQWAVINGEKESGVTIMQMEKGLDTGDMLCKKIVPLEEKETGASLHDKLMAAGAELIVEALPKIERGELIPEKQEGDCHFYASRLTKAMGLIDWEKDAVTIERLVRGLNSWPSAYTYYHGKTLKIWEADIMAGDIPMAGSATETQEQDSAEETKIEKSDALTPGSIARVGKDYFDVVTGPACGTACDSAPGNDPDRGILRVRSVQLEGKKRVPVKDFLLGYEVKPGLCLGRERA